VIRPESIVDCGPCRRDARAQAGGADSVTPGSRRAARPVGGRWLGTRGGAGTAAGVTAAGHAVPQRRRGPASRGRPRPSGTRHVRQRTGSGPVRPRGRAPSRAPRTRRQSGLSGLRTWPPAPSAATSSRCHAPPPVVSGPACWELSRMVRTAAGNRAARRSARPPRRRRTRPAHRR
jgi:hypothetical protein